MKNLNIKKVVLYTVFLVVGIFIVYTGSESLNKYYKSICYIDCVSQDLTKELGYQDDIAGLSSKRYSNIVLSYSSYTAYGSFSLSANYKGDDGKIVRLTGYSFDIKKEDISWPWFGDAEIYFKDGKIYLKGSSKILKSSSYEFSRKLNEAAYTLSLYARKHDNELKPTKLLDGSTKEN